MIVVWGLFGFFGVLLLTSLFKGTFDTLDVLFAGFFGFLLVVDEAVTQLKEAIKDTK